MSKHLGEIQNLRIHDVMCFCIIFFILLFSQPSFGDDNDRADGEMAAKTGLNVPFAFYNESFGFAVGYAYSVLNYPQKQSSVLATAMVGTEGSGMGFLMAQDLQLKRFERLFVDPIASIGYFSNAESYIDGNPSFVGQRAGRNDSDEDNYLEGDGWDTFFRLRFKYLLPLGHGKNQIITDYKIEDGLLKSGGSGGTSWNPATSGRTFIELRPFYRSQQIENDHFDYDQKTNGIDFAVFWDNRDFYANPSKGNAVNLKVSRDFGWANSSNSWTNLQGEFDFYFPLNLSESFRQTVLAFDLWTSYSPTWDEQTDGTVNSRPPAYTGSTLGGLWRMRGYPAQRFSDKAAICYSAELRLTPQWNPFLQWPQLQKKLGVQWMQLVPFVEIGRVAPSWNLNELHSDMKWDAGMGIRFMAKGLVARVDTAFSEEGFSTQMMISQPFQF